MLRKWRQFLLFILCLYCVFFFIIYIGRIQPESSGLQYNILKVYNSSRNPSDHLKRPQTILLWNSAFNYTRWGLPEDTLGPDYFREQRCPVVNCEVTNRKDFLPAVEMFDAVVFHVTEQFSLHPPYQRSTAQHYVFAIKEPPGKTGQIFHGEGAFYNLTMTYRLDSDILWPYMFFEDIESRTVVAPALSPAWRKMPTEYSDEQLDKLIAGKKKFAVWFVSYCEILSKREKLTKSLQRYVDVDVIGECRPVKCPHPSSRCDLMIDADYKFYFAFENSLCLDYVTEEFQHALRRQVVPVVFGGANYTRFAPPNSYINAEDFKTVKELADYLIYLSNHPKEYARFFWWRQYYRITFRLPFCDLCAKLNELAVTKEVKFYTDIEDWWVGGSCYIHPKILF